MRKLLFIILMPFLGIAQNFTANGINYTVTSSTVPLTVSVANNTRFTGVAEIPEIVVYNSENYAVTAIRVNAFNGSRLTSITIPNSVTAIGKFAFYNCTRLISISIPNSVTSIEEGTFSFCTGLISITIPNSVTVIGKKAFSECLGLTSVTFPNALATIGSYCFYFCTSLTSVTIPNSVTDIGVGAFYDCTSLSTVNCQITTPLVINVTTFRKVNKSTCALNVPAGTEAAYQAAAVWKDFSLIYGSLLSNHSFAIESNLKIYPNPVSEILNIALQEDLQLEKVNFYNTLGQLIKTTNHSEINVSSFTKGNYFVEIMTNQGKVTKTIIVQ
ncbi:leucine-rich repeat domain-containing protein [Flavobacterium psychrophilum]|uniref:Probable cell surface protein (Leucine-rich repeat protein) n=6 Tax=Flavobacterium psychrophilum TaxID=96345 RepID=A6GW23_FLAPJ|nr:leucine-rich repeat domain-containing protein [Flavobacterium psychrophilum]AIJ36696.1 flavobacterium repeat protein [Flavobacterium psychrophilum]AIN70704.1 cell surface protein [Flavobacterium psychrophilum FPG101]EKT3974657.1 leucine-rich repeat domain-containing protein [Flavobacterium psychrophilum]EKT4526908.1 leucine-rich repeat domain-containing protein [Flavobacterium psychrophilum]EKT4534967.1 leucine-rich repeat domain-containing protein [Flavobacterium psychrophilum]